ncbi:blue light receptor [Ceratobasidium sp. 414]|nr:blue light receptor [Ceratobasidium sp. 414]
MSTKPPPVFEFTKRKKWADILISELSGSLLLILNPSAHILWASPAIAEQLGWRDEELLERPIRDILHDDDAAPFADHLKRAVESHSELFSYARLRSKFASPRSGSHPTSPRSPTTPNRSAPSLNPPAAPSTTTPLFELRGHAIYPKPSTQSSSTSMGDAGPSTGSSSNMNLEANPNPNAEAEASCFIVMARPYPSRNTAMLDSFLELKIENERLRQQLLNLRTSGVPPSPVLASPAYPISQIASTSETPLLQPTSTLSSPIYPTASLGAIHM